MPTETPARAEAQIRELIDGWVDAVRSRDVNRIVANYAKDVVVFDAIPPLRYTGTEAYKKNWQECFDMIEGPVGYEMTELGIHAGDDTAFMHSINHLSGKVKQTGKQMKDDRMDMWFRATACFSRIGGKWQVTHEHASVPFYPDSNKAATELKP